MPTFDSPVPGTARGGRRETKVDVADGQLAVTTTTPGDKNGSVAIRHEASVTSTS